MQTYVHSRPKPLTGESGPDMLPPPPGTVGKAPSAGASGGAGISRGLEDDDGLYDIEEETEGAEEGDAEVMLSVECVGFSEGSFRWAASGGMDNTLKVTSGIDIFVSFVYQYYSKLCHFRSVHFLTSRCYCMSCC